MKKMYNSTHIEGLCYDHKLELKVSGPNSKNPGTEFISGTLSVVTDDAYTNIVPVHFSYVTATTKSGAPNATFNALKSIIDETAKCYMMPGVKENATRVRIDSNIDLNDFYSTRSGTPELVSAKRNEGGFVHFDGPWQSEEKNRNTFDADIIITNVRVIDADPDRNLPEKAIVKGAIFNFRNSLLPVEFSVVKPRAIDYFTNLGATSKKPVFTRVKGRQVSETVVSVRHEECAFDEGEVKTVESSRKDWVITWAATDPYLWDDESTITAGEVTDALAAREVYLASVKQRQETVNAAPTAPAAKNGFDF